jgi:hypothetical protein
MTTKRNGVPTLRAAAQRLLDDQRADPCHSCGGTGVAWDWPAVDDLRSALRYDADLSARRTRRIRGASAAEREAPVTPVPARGRR